MTPRTRLTTTPFSYRARIAEFVGEVDTFYVSYVVDMLITTMNDILTAYATCDGAYTGCLAKEINTFAQGYIANFANWLRLYAGACDTLIQDSLIEMVNLVETMALSDLVSYGALIQHALDENDIPALEQFDAEVHEHDLERLATFNLRFLNWVKEKVVDPAVGVGKKAVEWAKDNAEEIADKVVEDLPAVGDAAGKAADEIKKAISGAPKIK
jgi:hypothetical protein